MLKIIRQNKVYFTCLGLYFFIGAIALLFLQKGQLEVIMNRRHMEVLDYFFRAITLLGDGLFAVPLILIILLFNNIYKGIILAVSVLLTFACVQLLKVFIFADMPRPLGYFPKAFNLYYVKDMDIHSSHSFPSGHSAQAFAIFLVLALFSKNKNTGILFFLLALLTTFSRMYLMQHFLIDTYFGALIATLLTLFTYLYFVNNTNLSQKERWQKGILS